MVAIIIAICSSVFSGMALFFLQKFFKKKDKKDEVRDEIKARENILILKSINAVGKLTEANSIALQSGKTNGEMHLAMDEYATVNKEMYEYLLERNAYKNRV